MIKAPSKWDKVPHAGTPNDPLYKGGAAPQNCPAGTTELWRRTAASAGKNINLKEACYKDSDLAEVRAMKYNNEK